MDVLVGHTGLVGGTLLAQRPFDLLVHRPNLHALDGLRARRLVLSALPAEKWRINQDPAADLANMRRLQDALANVQAEQVVLVSTVDVYANPVDVDEDSPPGRATPYGAHRHAFEDWVRGRFARVLTIRLPGLFGTGLKKNALFDLLHGNEVGKLNPNAALQWYPLARLADDIDTALANGLALVNASVAPITTGAIAARLFPGHALVDPGTPPVLYRMRSRHAQAFGGQADGEGFWLDEARLWPWLEAWVAAERAGARASP